MNTPTGSTPASECTFRSKNCRWRAAVSGCRSWEDGCSRGGTGTSTACRLSAEAGGGFYADWRPPSRRRPASRRRIIAGFRAFAASLTLLLLGCPKPPPPPPAPTPTLAGSSASAEAFGLLRRRWAGATRTERVELEGAITELRARFASEPVVRLADLYLSWISLERGDYDRARALAQQADASLPGNVQDLSLLVRGATLARSGHPDEALAVLLPLVGKLLDPYARDLLHEEAVIAAVTAHQWREALRLLDIWMRDVPEDERLAVLEIARALLKQLPSVSIEQELAERLTSDSGAPRAEALDRAMARQVAEVALARHDSRLARRLLGQPGALVLLGDLGPPLIDLASRIDVPQVNGRRVGLLLPGGSPAQRLRGVELEYGALAALDLLSGDEGKVNLVLRPAGTTPGELRTALAGLDSEGASLILGGTDPEQARQVAEFAEEEGIAALLLAPPSPGGPASSWAFAFAPDPEAGTGAVLEELARRGAHTIAVVGASRALMAPGAARVLPSVDCAAFSPLDRIVRYPTQDWRARGVDALLIAGDARCAEDVLGEVSEAKLRVLVGLGLEASSLVLPAAAGSSPRRKPPAIAVSAALGCFPANALRQPSAEAIALQQRRGEPIGYWAMLGREAAYAAAEALARLPTDHTLDEGEVKRRRQQVREALDQGKAGCLGLRPGATPPVPRVN
jgi:tetratricopeptide (TPR) repeat protein